jgi:hypothetical protein
MKLAEALTKIKDLKGKVANLQSTLLTDATFQVVEDDQEVPSVENELRELEEVLGELRSLKSKIDVANVINGLVDKIHQMEQLKMTIKSLEPLSRIKQEVKTRDAYSSTPTITHTKATFNVESLKNVLDNHRRRVRELDLELQQLNWTVEV